MTDDDSETTKLVITGVGGYMLCCTFNCILGPLIDKIPLGSLPGPDRELFVISACTRIADLN